MNQFCKITFVFVSKQKIMSLNISIKSRPTHVPSLMVAAEVVWALGQQPTLPTPSSQVTWRHSHPQQSHEAAAAAAVGHLMHHVGFAPAAAEPGVLVTVLHWLDPCTTIKYEGDEH